MSQFYQQHHRCFEGVCDWTAGIITRAAAWEFHLSLTSSPICFFWELGITADWVSDCRSLTTTAQDLHIRLLHQHSLPETTQPDSCCNSWFAESLSFKHQLVEMVSGKLICVLRIPTRVWTEHLASGTLEKRVLHGWPGFTAPGRWQMASVVLWGWAVCQCQRCERSGNPWWRSD